ncbi:MAG: hypothetical protein LBU22_14230, partial [Dysgonamonadaceae bacterium]|nr:hypothetical protein [Dysgonamonadaceae bacterium]
ELGHGRFRLVHTFDGEYGGNAQGTEGQTDNLLDDGSGTHKAKWQWDLLFDPGLIVNPFEGDEAGMAMIDLHGVKNKDALKLIRDINKIVSKLSISNDASKLMDITSMAFIENIPTENIASATSLANTMVVSNKDAATVIFGLLFEFKYGIGPGTREFGENSVLTKGVQDFYLVEEGREFFYSNEERKKCKNNLPQLYDKPVKVLDAITKEGAFYPDFGVTGIPKAGLNLIQQYIRWILHGNVAR